jgi:hypothetical protein
VRVGAPPRSLASLAKWIKTIVDAETLANSSENGDKGFEIHRVRSVWTWLWQTVVASVIGALIALGLAWGTHLFAEPTLRVEITSIHHIANEKSNRYVVKFAAANLPTNEISWVVVVASLGVFPESSVLSCRVGICTADISLGEVGAAPAEYRVDVVLLDGYGDNLLIRHQLADRSGPPLSLTWLSSPHLTVVAHSYKKT